MQDNDIITGEALGEKLLESVRQMKAARQRTGLSQARFAELLGVSVRTLQEWEQGRRQLSGAARTLFKVAGRHLVR